MPPWRQAGVTWRQGDVSESVWNDDDEWIPKVKLVAQFARRANWAKIHQKSDMTNWKTFIWQFY